MDVFFYIFFLLETLLILLAMSTLSNARCQNSQTQTYFQKMSKYGSKYIDVLQSLFSLLSTLFNPLHCSSQSSTMLNSCLNFVAMEKPCVSGVE